MRYRDQPRRAASAPPTPGIGLSRKATFRAQLGVLLNNALQRRELEPWRWAVLPVDRQWTYDTLCWLHSGVVSGHG